MNLCNPNDTSSGVGINAVTETPLGINDVLSALKDIGEQREYLIRIILAVYISTFFQEKKNPLWLLLIGCPSSNKTTVVDLLKDSQHIYKLDALTANPFSSGQKEKDNPQDLLPLLNGKCFVIKELTTILSRSDELVRQLIGDLVAIYDGDYSKHSPTRGTKKYESYFSHIACITPHALEERQKYMHRVGPRYLSLRLPSLTFEEKLLGFKKIWEGQDALHNQCATKVVTRFCNELSQRLVDDPVKVHFPQEVQDLLNLMSEFLSAARGVFYLDHGVNPDFQDRDSQREEPFRVCLQLKKLAEALAIVDGRSVVGDSDLEIIRRVIFSSMSTQRFAILSLFFKNWKMTATDVATALRKLDRTSRRHLDDLVHLKVLVTSQSSNDKAKYYQVNPQFQPIMLLDSHELSSEN